MKAQTYTTQQIADAIGVSKMTILRWLYSGKIREPKRVKMNGTVYRIWNDRDVERVRKYKAKNYRKGRGRKPKKKA